MVYLTKLMYKEEVTAEETVISRTHMALVGSTLSAGNGETSFSDYLEKKNDMTVDVFAKEGATITGDGAMEYIIVYAKEHYGCPVMFYTGTKYDSDQYAKMVELTKEIQDKWDIGIINMWDELDTDIPEYNYYMANGIHPNRAGYLDWWTPFFEQEITEYLGL